MFITQVSHLIYCRKIGHFCFPMQICQLSVKKCIFLSCSLVSVTSINSISINSYSFSIKPETFHISNLICSLFLVPISCFLFLHSLGFLPNLSYFCYHSPLFVFLCSFFEYLGYQLLFWLLINPLLTMWKVHIRKTLPQQFVYHCYSCSSV